MSKFWRIFIIVLSFLSLGFSLFALYVRFPKIFYVDYSGIIVGVLALLVTAILTWSVAKTLDMKQAIDEFNKMSASFKSQQTAVDCDLNYGLCHLFWATARVKFDNPEESDFRCLLYGIKYLSAGVFQKQIDDVVATLNYLCDYVSYVDGLTPGHKRMLLNLLDSDDTKKLKLQKITELRDRIDLIPEVEPTDNQHSTECKLQRNCNKNVK